MDAGITVSIGMEGQMERMNTRNLPFYAGTYAAYGVEKEKAVQMITGNAAKILGIDSFTGTLEGIGLSKQRRERFSRGLLSSG